MTTDIPAEFDCPLASQVRTICSMERMINLHIEKLPEGFYLATSDDLPGLVAQGRTIQETLEIARDVGKKLLGSPRGACWYTDFSSHCGQI